MLNAQLAVSSITIRSYKHLSAYNLRVVFACFSKI